MNKLKRLFYTLTGGRPMKLKSRSFYDPVSRKMVGHYTDKFGREWFATSSWNLFRMKYKGIGQ